MMLAGAPFMPVRLIIFHGITGPGAIGGVVQKGIINSSE